MEAFFNTAKTVWFEIDAKVNKSHGWGIRKSETLHPFSLSQPVHFAAEQAFLRISEETKKESPSKMMRIPTW
jgi:hypothetical protein